MRDHHSPWGQTLFQPHLNQYSVSGLFRYLELLTWGPTVSTSVVSGRKVQSYPRRLCSSDRRGNFGRKGPTLTDRSRRWVSLPVPCLPSPSVPSAVRSKSESPCEEDGSLVEPPSTCRRRGRGLWTATRSCIVVSESRSLCPSASALVLRCSVDRGDS